MSVNGRVSGSNGRLSQKIKSRKGNESLHVSNSTWTCLWKHFLCWVFGVFVAIGSVWFIFSSFNYKPLTYEAACEKSTQTLLQRYNVSTKQLHALASLFSGSDQILSNCIDEKRLQILLSGGIVKKTPHSMCPKNQEFLKESRGVAESLGQCPVRDDFVEESKGEARSR
ncbi:unnamed protein product [Vicia faba]|uniref:Uncharacterized protein n=1 Tax=Vicia faba TaxID=3906 RepID=A0AAV0YPH0_VICFA|nr:unnamed protein product [Vicia faba]